MSAEALTGTGPPADRGADDGQPRIDLGAMRQSLRTAEGAPAPEPDWLAESRRHPGPFWDGLLRDLERRSARPVRSEPFKRYDLFQDLVGRHRTSEVPAMRWHEGRAGWREISYAELDQRARSQALAWTEAGAGRGGTVCIIFPMGASFAVALLAAFRMGMVVSVLPPGGRSLIRGRLTSLAPDHIAADAAQEIHLSEWRDRLLPDAPPGGPTVGSADRPAAYGSGEPALRCFDPGTRHPHLPVDVSADALFFGALRDGPLALGLGIGGAVAAPGFHFLETQPFLLAAALMAGATFIHIEGGRAAERPELLAAHSVKALGISKAVRESLRRNPVDLSEICDLWFREPALSMEAVAWQSMVGGAGLENTWAGNLKWAPAVGGCALFSPRRKGLPPAGVFPSAGLSWRPTDLRDRGIPPVEHFGALSVGVPWGDPEEPLHLPTLLMRVGGEWAYAGAVHPGRGGRTYPREEVLAALARQIVPGDFSVVAAPGADGLDHAITLLAFAGPEGDIDPPAAERILREFLAREFGEDHLPDRIRVYPLRAARGGDSSLDDRWCEAHFLSGGLDRRALDEIHRSLSRIRARLYE